MYEQKLAAEGRIVMISGANRGIGKAIAERLYQDGYRLSLGVRNSAQADQEFSHWDNKRAMICRYDAIEKDSANEWVDATVKRFGGIDAIVNNAGVLRNFEVLSEDEDQLDEMWQVNVKAPLRIVRHAFDHLTQTQNGRVINIVSMSGKRVKSGAIAGYAMSKHAALAFTHAIRHQGWEAGIRATAVCPGCVATDMTTDVQSFPHQDMSPPGAIADMVSMLLTLPNSACIAELPVNCVLESQY